MTMTLNRLSILSTLLALILIGSPTFLMADIIAIKGGKVYTMGPYGVLKNATILIENQRIVDIGKQVTIPSAAKIIDAKGAIVTPGLINAYTQVGLVEVSHVAATNDTRHRHRVGKLSLGAGFDAIYGINPLSTLIPITRIAGITSVMSAPLPGDSLFAGLGAMIHLGMDADFLMQSASALFIDLGETGAKNSGGTRGSAFSMITAALEDAQDFVQHPKAYLAGDRYGYSVSRQDLAVLARTLQAKLSIAAKVHRAEDIRAWLRLAKRFALKVIIIGGAEAWMLGDELAASNIPVILNPLQNLPNSFAALGATLENAARLQQAGVLIAFGNDDNMSGYGTHNARMITQMAGNAVANGLDWQAALAAITINPAKIWGISQHTGAIVVGKYADLVVWHHDPLELSAYPLTVLIKGTEIPLQSRQTELLERYRDLSKKQPPFAYRKRQ